MGNESDGGGQGVDEGLRSFIHPLDHSTEGSESVKGRDERAARALDRFGPRSLFRLSAFSERGKDEEIGHCRSGGGSRLLDLPPFSRRQPELDSLRARLILLPAEESSRFRVARLALPVVAVKRSSCNHNQSTALSGV